MGLMVPASLADYVRYRGPLRSSIYGFSGSFHCKKMKRIQEVGPQRPKIQEGEVLDCGGGLRGRLLSDFAILKEKQL